MDLSEFDSIEDFMKAEGKAEGIIEGKAEGIIKAKAQAIKTLLSSNSMKLSIRKIAELFEVSQSYVVQLKEELKAEKPKLK